MAGGAHMTGRGDLSNRARKDADGAESGEGDPDTTSRAAEAGTASEGTAPSAAPSLGENIPDEESDPVVLATEGGFTQRLWPMLAVVTVVVGLLFGYAFFT